MNIPKEILADIRRLGIANCALVVEFKTLRTSDGGRDGCVVQKVLTGFDLLAEIHCPSYPPRIPGAGTEYGVKITSGI